MNKAAIVLLIFFILLIVGVLAQTTPRHDDGVYILTDINFKDFITSKPFVLIYFYASWCDHCRKLAPEYIQAAAALQTEGINAVLARIDATAEKGATKYFNIKGYPTLLFFSGSISEPVDFHKRTSTSIVNQIKKMTKKTEILSTSQQLAAFLAKNFVAIVYFGGSENDDKHSTFQRLAMSLDKFAFACVFSPELRIAQDVYSPNFVLYKQFEEKRNDFTGAATLFNLMKWVKDKSLPTLMPFNDKLINKFLKQSHPILLLIANDNEASIAAEAAFSQAAKDNKGKVLFSISKFDDGLGYYQQLPNLLSVNIAKVPNLMLVHIEDEVKIYQFPSNKITVEKITSFVNDFKADKLKVYLLSQEIPSINEEPVKVVVGKSFDAIVKNTTADVLVQFYTPWCKDCKELAPIYEAVAKKLTKNTNIILSKINFEANDVPGVSIDYFPTLMLFLNGKKDQPVDFEGDKTEKGIIKFLKEKSSHPWVEAKEEL